jgi:hypothetical protein
MRVGNAGGVFSFLSSSKIGLDGEGGFFLSRKRVVGVREIKSYHPNGFLPLI